jgi:hypothetical protein
MLEDIKPSQGVSKMIIPILKSAALLAGAAGFTYALLNGTAASPIRSGAIQMLSRVAPETACQLDTVLCLQRHEAELREIGKNAADQGFELLSERDKRSAELKAAETAVSDNARLLSTARDLYVWCAMNGQVVDWKGARYSPAEFKGQVQLLWEEKAILEAARDRQRRFSEQLEDDLRANGTLRAKVHAELSLMPARIDQAHRAVLTADFDRVIGEISQLEGSADRQIKDTSLKLRTTSELIKAEPPKAEAGEPPRPQSRNPDFESFLSGAPRS